MQFEMTNSTCALCKSAFAPSANAYPGPSRLCLACQHLVQTILPRAGMTAVQGAAPAPGALFDTVAVKEIAYAPAAEAAPTSDNGFEYAEEIREIESDFYRPEEESYYKTEFEIQPDPNEVADFVEDFPGAPHQALDEDESDLSGLSSIEFPPSVASVNEEAVGTVSQSETLSYEPEPAADAWQNATQIYGAQPVTDYIPPTAAPLTVEEIEANTVEANPVPALAQGYDEQATDPWENPLPSWDYSQSEYPVLLGPKKIVNRKRLFWIIVAGLLVASFAIGYFILARPNAAQKDNQPVAAGWSDNQAALATEDNSTAAAVEQQNVSPETSAETASTQAPKPADPTEFGSVGSITLQSAAFPDEAGANEFSTKLIRAGVPAYVVPADLVGKGRWFRVRVGRFSNADDAKKYAVQSRLRAKAAGMNVDFIVVEYGKP